MNQMTHARVQLRGVLVIVAILCLASFTLYFGYTAYLNGRQYRSEQIAAQILNIDSGLEQRRQVGRAQKKRLDSLVKSGTVSPSILMGLTLTIAWHSMPEGIHVHVKKNNPDEEFFVDSFYYGCVLFRNNRPVSVLSTKQKWKSHLQYIEKSTSGFSTVIEFDKAIIQDSKIFVEWHNFNSQTGEVERLRSNTLIIP